MDASALIPHLGHSVASVAVRSAFKMFGIDLSSELVLPEGEFHAYVELPTAGLAFVFSDEAMFLGIGDQPSGMGPLHFGGVFYYAGGIDGYSRYAHALPWGLLLSDDADAARRKFGAPEFERLDDSGKPVGHRWSVDGRRLHITYAQHTGAIAVVAFSVPDADLRIAANDS